MPTNQIFVQSNLKTLFTKWVKEEVLSMTPLPVHGSERTRWRIKGKTRTCIGTYNPNLRENRAFLYFSQFFKNQKIPVPEIYETDLTKNCYLEEDLGDTTLFAFITKNKGKEKNLPEESMTYYKEALKILPKFQITSHRNINYQLCYPKKSFDLQSMKWDLHYFKYYFLKLAKIPFSEEELENDFNEFARFLEEAPRNFFLYRDFQSRNIMIKNDSLYFIDYQGGREGALQYDVASLLFDAKAALLASERKKLLEYYLVNIEKDYGIDTSEFMRYWGGYVLMRIMQAMGAYGFRGFFEQKTQFLESIPYAIKNIEHVLRNENLPIKIPELTNALQGIVQSTYLRQFGSPSLTLTLHIQSFSYSKGIPRDLQGHGGGFVFDCRALPNPGRLEEMKMLTGNDKKVIEYLKKEKGVKKFLDNTMKLVSQSVENYRQRNFTDLSVAFGCTGGQHRSVFCANWLAKKIKDTYKIEVDISHREINPQV